MSEIKTLKITLMCCLKGWCWRWCALQLILFPPHFETEEKNIFMSMVCFCFGNPEDEEKIKRRTGLKHTRILGNVYTINVSKIQNSSLFFSTQRFACVSIQCLLLNSGHQKRWRSVLYHFKSMIECFKYKTRFYLAHEVWKSPYTYLFTSPLLVGKEAIMNAWSPA